MKRVILTLIIMILGGVFMVGTTPAFAANQFNQQACNSGSLSDSERATLGCDNNNTAPSVATEIIKVVVSLVGIVAVIMIIVAGQRYIVSNGEPEKIKQARNMLIYSLVGLVIAGLAFTIVIFVQNGVFGR